MQQWSFSEELKRKNDRIMNNMVNIFKKNHLSLGKKEKKCFIWKFKTRQNESRPMNWSLYSIACIPLTVFTVWSLRNYPEKYTLASHSKVIKLPFSVFLWVCSFLLYLCLYLIFGRDQSFHSVSGIYCSCILVPKLFLST